MLDSETKRRIDSARDILVGKVPDPKSQVEQITIALIYKFMDDMDTESEELGGERSFFRGEFEKYAWRRIFDPRMGGFEILNLYSEAIIKMNINPDIPQLFRDIFKNAYLPYRDPETLKAFLKTINDFSYDHSERLGDAFEYLLSVLGSQGEAGQFRTPRHIIDFMVALIDPKKDEVIMDPACGTAGFLISSYKHIIKNNSSNYDPATDIRTFETKGQSLSELIINSKNYKGDKLTPDERNRLANNIKGYDISPDMVRLSLVNMYLHGLQAPHIYEYDTLTSEDNWNEYADVILANPPFMSPKGGIRPHKRFSITSNRSEVLFVDYIAEHLTPDGRAAVIVPEGIIFQSGTAYKNLRKMLVEKYLVGVISLPAGVFQPYSGVKTSILWLDRAMAKKTDKILFVKIENDGFDLGAQRKPIRDNDLPKAISLIIKYRNCINAGLEINNPEYHIVRKELINGQDSNLSGDRYKIEAITSSSKYDLCEIGDICDLINGKAFKPTDWTPKEEGGLPIIRIQNLNEKEAPFNFFNGMIDNRYRVINGDLLFSWSGSRGSSFGAHIWQGADAVLNQHIFKVIFDENLINRDFLYYVLNSAVEEIEKNLHGGVGLVHITKANLQKVKLPLPPLSIQEEIVAEIDSYQKIIDGARQVVENYKPRIDIDPGWPMVELGDHINFISGVTLSIPDCERTGGTPIISMNSLTEDGELVKEGIREIELPNKKNINFLQKGDLLFNWRNGSTRLVGKTGYFDWEGTYVFASFLLGIRTKSESFIPRFLWLLLNQYRFDGMYVSFMRQNVNGLFNREELKILKVPLPTLEEQSFIISKTEREMNLIKSVKELITINEQKIMDRIAKVWGEKG